MKKKEILQKIKGLKERREWLYNPRTDPLVATQYEAYERFAGVVRKDRKPEIDETLKEQAELEKLLATTGRKKYEPSDGLKSWLANLYLGIRTGTPSIYWASEDERFVIVRESPTMSWGGLGQPPVYCPAEYYIVDRNEKSQSHRRGQVTVMDIHKIHQVNGRLPKAEFDNWIKETKENLV